MSEKHASRLRAVDEPFVTEPVAPSLVSTAISSQDGPQLEPADQPPPTPS